MLQKLMRTDDDLTGLIARLTLAVVIFPHGAQKALGWYGGGGFSGTMDFFTGQGMPAVLAFLVILGEFLGPISLALGFLSRFSAASLGVIMLGAIGMVHGQHGFFMNWFGNQEGEGFEYHLLVLGLAAIVVVKGSGLLSLDRKLSR